MSVCPCHERIKGIWCSEYTKMVRGQNRLGNAVGERQGGALSW
ncbi:hypothetical protein [Haemophilus influenzae]|nr:hypothetical protein [Haemophilus influenzae]